MGAGSSSQYLESIDPVKSMPFLQGDLNVAKSFEHWDSGRPGVGIVVVPCGDNKSVQHVTKLMLEFW